MSPWEDKDVPFHALQASMDDCLLYDDEDDDWEMWQRSVVRLEAERLHAQRLALRWRRLGAVGCLLSFIVGWYLGGATW